jgi:ferredoxin
MIISKPKPFEEILASLEGEEKVFLVGCSECATVCQVGGEEQLTEMAEKLSQHGKTVTGSLVAEPGCHLLGLKRELRAHKEEVEGADSLLVMSCGNGAQTTADATDKPVHIANDTLFIGRVERFGQYREMCSACSECILEQTGNICPVTRCAKGLLNGPCGGTTAEGKCEVDADVDCGWLLIYERLKKREKVEGLKEYVPPKESHPHPGERALSKEGEKE